jgi:hypothetical protein
MRTAVFRLCGHAAMGPMAVLDQSNERILSPSSPPPEKTSSGVWLFAGNEEASLGAGESDCCRRVVKKLVGEPDLKNSLCRKEDLTNRHSCNQRNEFTALRDQVCQRSVQVHALAEVRKRELGRIVFAGFPSLLDAIQNPPDAASQPVLLVLLPPSQRYGFGVVGRLE